MAIPNTTPTPNELYNGEMKKMTDTELRVVLVVTRATFGWVIDKETGRRKKEDWISRSQLMEKTGRGSRAISTSIDNCVKNGWIEIRDEEGNILDTAEKRKKAGKKLFYRLGGVFLKNTIEYNHSNNNDGDHSTQCNEPSHLNQKTIAKSAHYKRNSTKEILQNDTKSITAKQPLENYKKYISYSKKQDRFYGDKKVDQVIVWLMDYLDLKILDGTRKTNRRYANLTIKKAKGNMKAISALIRYASQDKWYSAHITSAKDLYYSLVKLAKQAKEYKPNLVRL